MNIACLYPRLRTASRVPLLRRGVSLVRLSLIVLVAAFLVEACHGRGPLEVYGTPPGTFSIAVGQEIAIQMGTVGPGEYVSPPTLSGSTIEFLEVTLGAPVPAGPRQIFHFKGIASGQTIILFHNTSPDLHPDVSDTVVVR